MTRSLAYGKRYKKEFYIFLVLEREFCIANGLVLEHIRLMNIMVLNNKIVYKLLSRERTFLKARFHQGWP